MRFIPLASVCAILCFTGCIEDYDVADVAPEDYLDQEHHHEHGDAFDECAEEHGTEGDELQLAVESTPSGHSHGAGVRNHGTQWFFNQPWAAPFIWGKLARDGGIFLGLAALILYVTGRKRR